MGMLHPNKGSSADALPCTTQAESPDPHQTPKVTQTKAAVLSSLHHIRASDIVNQEYKMEEQ